MRRIDSVKSATIAELRQKIQHLEGFKAHTEGCAVRFGIPEVDNAFPDAYLPTGAIHEFISHNHETAAATEGFVASILSAIAGANGPIVWITKNCTMFVRGLNAFRIDTDHVVWVELSRDKEILWAMEDALRCKGLAAVIGEITDIDLTATRRMQLAVEDSGVTGFLLRNDPKKLNTTASMTRWRITSLPSSLPDGVPGIGFPRWHVELLKVRNGTPGEWDVEWQAGGYRLAKDAPVETRNTYRQIGAV